LEIEFIVNFVDHEFFDDTRGLKEKELASRLICFGVDIVNTFQGLIFGIIVQIQY
jgi:hypothetical protein